jgi:hypothetical protein
MKYTDPDTFVTWYRVDNPGEFPAWESQCGLIEQRSFGDNPQYVGFVGGNKTPLPIKTLLSAAKAAVEAEYTKTAKLEWSYDD